MLNQDNYIVSVKLNYCYRQTQCIDDQDKFQSVPDTTMDSLNVKHQRHSFNQLAFHLPADTFMKTLKINISEAYKVQVDCFRV